MGLVALAAVIYAVMSLYFSRENERRARGDEDHTIVGMSKEDVDEMGDRSPRFVYSI